MLTESVYAFQAEFNGTVWNDVLRMAVPNQPADVEVKVYVPGP